jgi:hypothetical protein
MSQQTWTVFDTLQCKSLILINFPLNKEPPIAPIILIKLEVLLHG